MKKLLPFLFVCLLASCQFHSLGLTEEEVKASSLEELLTAERLKEEEVKERMGRPAEDLLCHAAYEGWLPVVHKLLLQGLDVNSKDRLLGSPPLHWAAFNGHTAVAALLLSHGADLMIKNNRGGTALQWAQSQNKKETAAFLALAGGKSKEWLEAYYKGFSYKKKHEKNWKKLHTYARVYAEMYEEQKDHDMVFTAMPYYFRYLEEDKLSHQEAKEGAIMMVHCL